jgi:hypothetical protein
MDEKTGAANKKRAAYKAPQHYYYIKFQKIGQWGTVRFSDLHNMCSLKFV